MTKFRLLTSLALALTLVFTSCSVEKRHYTRGYNVAWNTKKEKTTETAKATEVENTTATTTPVATEPATPATQTTAATTEQASTTNEEIITTAKPYEYNASQPQVVKEKGLKKVFAQYNYMMGKSKVGNVVKKQYDKAKDNTSAKGNAETGGNILAILAFVFGIIALFAYYGSFVLAVVAIIMGAIALNRSEGIYHTFALLGLVFGLIAIVLWLLLFAFVIGGGFA